MTRLYAAMLILLIWAGDRSGAQTPDPQRHEVKRLELKLQEAVNASDYKTAYECQVALLRLKQPTAFDYERASFYAIHAGRDVECQQFILSALALSDADFESDRVYTDMLYRQTRVEQRLEVARKMDSISVLGKKSIEQLLRILDSPTYQRSDVVRLQELLAIQFKETGLDAVDLFRWDTAQNKSAWMYLTEPELHSSFFANDSLYVTKKHPYDSILLHRAFVYDRERFELTVDDAWMNPSLARLGVDTTQKLVGRVFHFTNYSLLKRFTGTYLMAHNSTISRCKDQLINILERYTLDKVKYRRDSIEQARYQDSVDVVHMRSMSSNLFLWTLTGGIGMDMFLSGVFGDYPFPAFNYEVGPFNLGVTFRYDHIIDGPARTLVSLNLRSMFGGGRFDGMSNIVGSLSYRANQISVGPALFGDAASNVRLGVIASIHSSVEYYYSKYRPKHILMQPKEGDLTTSLSYFPDSDLSVLFGELSLTYVSVRDRYQAGWSFSVGSALSLVSGRLYEPSDDSIYGGLRFNLQIGIGKLGAGVY